MLQLLETLNFDKLIGNLYKLINIKTNQNNKVILNLFNFYDKDFITSCFICIKFFVNLFYP